MKRQLAFIFALLCAGTAQAETDMSQYLPTLHCGPVPKGRVVINEGGRKEVAGKRLSFESDGRLTKIEERYITIKGQKCAVRVFALLTRYHPKTKFFPNENRLEKPEEYFAQQPASSTVLKAVESQYDTFSSCYNESLGKLILEKSNLNACLAQVDQEMIESRTERERVYLRKKRRKCSSDMYNDFDRRGFVGYYIVPEKKELACRTSISGFYYMDGEIGLLKEFLTDEQSNGIVH